MNHKARTMKKEHVRKLHVVMTQRVIDTLSREELLAAKYGGLEFTRPERTAVNLIERPRVAQPMTFSLANLLPVGV
jgi:siderophore synthetase component